jgi:hypothetical protein
MFMLIHSAEVLPAGSLTRHLAWSDGHTVTTVRGEPWLLLPSELFNSAAGEKVSKGFILTILSDMIS